MKLFISMLMIHLCLGLAFAGEVKELELSPKLLKCARSIVEKGFGEKDGLLFVGQLLDSQLEDGTKLSHCKNFQLTSEAKALINRDSFSAYIKSLEVKPAVKKLLTQFNKPFYECRFKNIEAPIAEGFGIGKGLGAAKCIGTNKRTYILLMDEKSYGLDFISKAFSQNIFVDKNNKLLDLDPSPKASAIGEYLGEVLETDLELDEIGTRALSGRNLGYGHKSLNRIKAISVEQV